MKKCEEKVIGFEQRHAQKTELKINSKVEILILAIKSHNIRIFSISIKIKTSDKFLISISTAFFR